MESYRIVWPRFFVDPATASAPPARVGARASIEANRSLAEQFDRGTLKRGLPSATLPALFVHGEHDPMPLRATTETAALVDGARVVPIPGSAHFPWIEQPEAFRSAVEAFVAEQSASPASIRGR